MNRPAAIPSHVPSLLSPHRRADRITSEAARLRGILLMATEVLRQAQNLSAEDLRRTEEEWAERAF